MQLRTYQNDLVAQASAGSDNVLIQADTGAGKTPVLAALARSAEHVLFIAHRNVLIKQAAVVLAKNGVEHDLICSSFTRRSCIFAMRQQGIDERKILKKGRYVCSIDTLLSRYRRGLLQIDVLTPWMILVDEAHHMVDQNKWGMLAKIFKHSRIIGATATPCRLDQISLAHDAGGVFHRLAQAEELKINSVEKLIKQGFLSDFKCYSLPEVVDDTKLRLGKIDYVYKSLCDETRRVCYRMAGDAIKHYKRLANGKQALAFCVAIDVAEATAKAFRDAGISAACVHSGMAATDVSRVFQLFWCKEITVLFNVDMVGEGFDMPDIEALIMLRKTASFGLYRQWVGRALRPAADKIHAIIIDHTGNVRSHGLPDKHIEWSLYNPPQAEKNNLMPCPDCHFLIKAWVQQCPECGADCRRALNAKQPVDMKYIDYNLVQIKHRAIDEQCRKAAIEQDMHENLQLKKKDILQMGYVNKGIHMLKLWCADVLLNSGVDMYAVNLFFEQHDSNDFWMDRFKMSDINSKPEKCTEVYAQWQG